MNKFIEDATLSGTRRTADGYLTASVRVARTGIQDYAGYEVGRPDLDVVSVYRPESEVFSKDSLTSYPHKPITDDHPSDLVSSANWKDVSRGSIGDEVARDGEYVRVPVLVMDEDAIAKIEAGKRELSMGYLSDIVWEDGETPDGRKYQAKQTNLRMNHLAIVSRGRAGHECRVGDNAGNQWGASPTIPQQGERPMSDKKLTTVAVDGLSVETTDQGAQAIQKLQKAIKSHDSDINSLKEAHKQEVESKDSELGKKDAEIQSLKDKQLSDGDLDALIAERSDLIESAKLLAKDADFTGKSNNEIRSIAVQAVRGEDSVLDKSEAYVQGAFDAAIDLAKSEKTNKFAEAVKSVDRSEVKDNGQSAYEARLSNAWKKETK